MSNSRLRVVPLEDRVTPAVTVAAVADQTLFDNRPLYLPLSATNTPAGAVNAAITASDSAVSAEVLKPGRAVRFDVSGTDSSGAAFAGSITLRLFDDSAPNAAQRVVDLVNNGFYTGKLFHRVIPGFVIQGGSPNGDGVGGSTLPTLDDEFNTQYTFASPGIVAFANSGDDTNNSQFFVADPSVAAASRPVSLDFNYSIVGILAAGFDTYSKVINTPRTTSAGGENSRPVNPVTITKATVFSDTADTILKVSAPRGYRGTATVKYNVTDTGDAGSTPAQGTFAVTGAADAVNSRAFLNPPPTAVSVGGDPATVQFSGTDINGDALTYAIRDTNFSGAPAGLTATVDASTGLATLTPPAGFFGTVQFKVGVRDQTDRDGRGLDSASNFDTQLVTLTVAPRVTLTAPPALTAGQAGTFTADVSGPADTSGKVDFLTADGGITLATAAVANGRATATATFADPGNYSVIARFTPADTSIPVAVSASSAVGVAAVTVPPTTPPTTPPPPPASPPATPPPPASPPATPPTVPPPPAGLTPVSVSNVSAGSQPVFVVGYSDGTSRRVAAFDASFLGGVTTLLTDVTGDGVADVVAVPASGGSSLVKVFDARTGVELFVREAFESTYRGGLSVSAGDFARKGYSQIVVGAGVGGGPRVAVFDVMTGATVLDFFAGDPDGRAGVTVAATAEGLYATPRILTTAGTAGGLFDGTTGQQVQAYTAPPVPPTSSAAPAGAVQAAAARAATTTGRAAAGVSMRAFLGSTTDDGLAVT